MSTSWVFPCGALSSLRGSSHHFLASLTSYSPTSSAMRRNLLVKFAEMEHRHSRCLKILSNAPIVSPAALRAISSFPATIPLLQSHNNDHLVWETDSQNWASNFRLLSPSLSRSSKTMSKSGLRQLVRALRRFCHEWRGRQRPCILPGSTILRATLGHHQSPAAGTVSPA